MIDCVYNQNRVVVGEPFFVPLYRLFLTYGGIFRLTFHPKSFVTILDPMVAKHILKDNSKSYSKVTNCSDCLKLSTQLCRLFLSNMTVARSSIVLILDMQGILAEILDFIMGKGLIPADGEVRCIRRRAIVRELHRKYVEAMLELFGQVAENLCKKLDVAATNGEDVEMESLFSWFTLD